MDSLLSSKDAARSKWRHSQRHQPSRGRGGGVMRGNESRSTLRRGPELGTNVDRYLNDEEGAEDGEHAGTANRGADLAEWLEQCQRQPDLSFYPRRRNDAEFQLEEWWRFGGVGSAGNTSDELPAVELDLKLEELAAGISTLPLHEYLRLPDIMRDADTVDDDGSECEQQAQGTKEGKIEEQVRGADQHEAGPLMALEKGEQMDMLDQELDSLLTLSERPHALEKDNAEKDSVVQQSFPPGAGDQSLEDWLDSL